MVNTVAVNMGCKYLQIGVQSTLCNAQEWEVESYISSLFIFLKIISKLKNGCIDLHFP